MLETTAEIVGAQTQFLPIRGAVSFKRLLGIMRYECTGSLLSGPAAPLVEPDRANDLPTCEPLYIADNPACRISLESHECTDAVWTERTGGHRYQDRPNRLTTCRGYELTALPVNVVNVVLPNLIATDEGVQRH